MDYKKAAAAAAVLFVFGAVFGAGIAYLSYNSEIKNLKFRVSGLESEILRIEEEGISGVSAERATELGENVSVRYLSEEKQVISAYNKIASSVVFVTTSFQISGFFGQQAESGTGSGVIISEDGYILTNNHVIEDAETVRVGLADGSVAKAEIIGTDPDTDLAVLKINVDASLEPAVLGDSNKLSVGMKAIAVGTPFNLERTATLGIISALNRTIDTDVGTVIKGIIQTDASINPGNSGGPLVTLDGKVIGINSAILSPVQGSIGIGFAIPINMAKEIMNELIKEGKVRRAWLGITGISVEDLPQEVKSAGSIDIDYGVLIADVVSGSPAERAGLKGSELSVTVEGTNIPYGGDIIIALDNKKMESIDELVDYIRSKKPGERIKIEYLRENVKKETTAQLAEKA